MKATARSPFDILRAVDTAHQWLCLPRRRAMVVGRGSNPGARQGLSWLLVWLAGTSSCLVAGGAPALEPAAAAPQIIAHRGASHDAPENTLAAFRLAWEQAADAVELDIRLTADGRIVALHDRTTERTTGVVEAVAVQTLAELRRQDAGTWKGPQWADQVVPTLGEALATVPDGRRLLIEIKCGPEVLPALEQSLRAAGRLPEQTALIGFDYETMCQARQRFPMLDVYWIVSAKKSPQTGLAPRLDDLAARAKAAGFTGLDLDARFDLDAAAVTKLKQQSLQVLVWTVNDAETAARLAAAGVDGITTDRPGWLREQLGASPGPALTRWDRQAAEDARHDRTSIAYDGVSPNKMVCDTTLRELSDGSWILFLLAGGDTEPSPKNYTGVTRSTDQGRTWSPLEGFNVGFPRVGTTVGQGPTELMVHRGRCTLFFSTHSKHWNSNWRSWFITSDDACRTWSPPQPVPGRLKERTFIRNHIVARDGRILLPFQHYVGPDAEQARPPLDRAFTNPRNGVLMSGDGGQTWTEHGSIRLTADDRYFGWAENNIVELADGRIAMIIRGDKLGGVLYGAESSDGGRTWPEFAHKTDIPNPGSKATLYALGGDAVALLHNPNAVHRSPLALWISFDGMKTWPYRRVLVAESCDGPGARMNYPDGFVSPDKQWLHFAFDDNRHRAVCYSAKLPPLP